MYRGMLQGGSYKIWCKALLWLTSISAQLHAEEAPSFRWAKQFAGTNSAGLIRINSHCMDELGNSYLTGRLQGDMHFDGQLLLFGGSIFLVKLDRSGNVVWARRDGGTNSQGYAIARSPDGHIYVFARVGVTPATIAGQTITSSIPGHAVLAKYTAEGEGVWARRVVSGSGTVEPSGMVADRSGAIYWTARISQSPITIGATNITHTGWSSPVIVKCDDEGAVTWVKAIRGGATDGVTIGEPGIDKNTNVYVCGNFTGSADFGSTNLATPADAQIYVAKYNADGDVLWVRQAGGVGRHSAHRNTLDASGNFIVSGSF